MLPETSANGNATNHCPPVGTEPRYDRTALLQSLLSALVLLRFDEQSKGRLTRACHFFVDALDTCEGRTLQERWIAFEQTVWPKWVTIRDPLRCARRTWGGAWIAVVTRRVRPTAKWVGSMRLLEWIKHLPDGDPLVQQRQILATALESVHWAGHRCKQVALTWRMHVLSWRMRSNETASPRPHTLGRSRCALFSQTFVVVRSLG